jgi:hypothetical protein
MLVHICNSSTGEVKAEDRKLQAILGCTASMGYIERRGLKIISIGRKLFLLQNVFLSRIVDTINERIFSKACCKV